MRKRLLFFFAPAVYAAHILLFAQNCFCQLFPNPFLPPPGDIIRGKEQFYIHDEGSTQISWSGNSVFSATFDETYPDGGAFTGHEAIFKVPEGKDISDVHVTQKGDKIQVLITLLDGTVYTNDFNSHTVFNFRDIGTLYKTGDRFKRLKGDALYALSDKNTYVSRDTAHTWTIDTIGLNGTPLNDIAVDSAQVVYGVSATGFYKQNPDVNSWTLEPTLSANSNPQTIFIDRLGHIYIGNIVNGYRYIYHSFDHGASWAIDTAGFGDQPVHSFGDDAFGNIFAIASKYSQVSGEKIYRSNGSSWKRIDGSLRSLNMDSSAYPEIFTDIGGDSVLTLTSDYGIFSSIDQGNTWKESNKGIPAERVFDLQFTASKYFVASTHLGVFRRKQDDTVWAKTFPKVGYLGSQPLFHDNSGALYTLGETITPADKNNLYPPRIAMKSTDDGETWNPDSSGLYKMNTISRPTFFVDEKGIQHAAAGLTGIYVKFPGQSWSGDSSGYAPTGSDNSPNAFGSDGNYLYLATGYNPPVGIWRRPLSGGAWAPDISGFPQGTNIYRFAAGKNGILYGGAADGVYKRSGSSWSKLSPPSGISSSPTGFEISIDSTGALIAAYGHYDASYNYIGDGIFSTTDDGNTWKNLEYIDTITFPRLVSYGDVTYGLSFSNSVFTFTSNPLEVTSTPVLSLTMLSVFPNPAGSEIHINYAIPLRSNVTLSLDDIMGREIMAITDGTRNPGSYEKIFDVRSLLNGSYILKITACGESIEKILEVVH